MQQDIERILISEEDLQARIKELGQQLAQEYADKNPIFLGILKGVILFFGDMIRATPIRSQIDLMAVSSYGAGTESSGTVNIKKDVSLDLAGRHVVILEDIIDSGLTLTFLRNNLITRGAKSLKICTLLDKPERRNPNSTITVDYRGFVIPNEFVVGYGLDYDEKYRNLPEVGVLKPEIYAD